MSEFLIVLVFLFIAIFGCLGVGFLIYGCAMLIYSVIEIIMIKLEELKGGNENEK